MSLRDFIQHHRIAVIDDNKRAYKHTHMNTRFFQFPEDYNMMTATQSFQYETERLYTIEIAESELESIAKFESEVFNNMKQTGHYRLFETMMEQKAEERYLRDKYPAVKKSYEHYSLMLKLAESGEL